MIDVQENEDGTFEISYEDDDLPYLIQAAVEYSIIKMAVEGSSGDILRWAQLGKELEAKNE